ncbi:MAG: hypothetical protein LH479_01135 [Polaromonas sp.]|nr:hypothetical protein [Polaromonas sp.]
MRLETPDLTFGKCNSPLNCTSSHFIRINFASKPIDTSFFNEINDLDQPKEQNFDKKSFEIKHLDRAVKVVRQSGKDCAMTGALQQRYFCPSSENGCPPSADRLGAAIQASQP